MADQELTGDDEGEDTPEITRALERGWQELRVASEGADAEPMGSVLSADAKLALLRMMRNCGIYAGMLDQARLSGFCAFCVPHDTESAAQAEKTEKMTAHMKTCAKHPYAKLLAEWCRLDDEIVEWKEASGLLAGGDPGGVEPQHLRKHIQMLDDLARAAGALIDEAEKQFVEVAQVAHGQPVDPVKQPLSVRLVELAVKVKAYRELPEGWP